MLRVLVLSVLLACCAVDAAPARVSVDTSLDLPWFSYEGDSHFEFGEALGKQFRVEINDRLRLSSQLQGVLLPFYATPLGKSTYDKYLSAHNHTFPVRPAIPLLKCHRSDVNRTALVTAKIKNNPWFTAFTYLGDLPTGAFGANQHGVAFSMNCVKNVTIVCFVGRQPVFPSSYHRLRRYTHVTPPSSVASILALLGDQVSERAMSSYTSYPIFHDDKSHAKGELSNWTLITVLFDVKNGVLYLLRPRVNPGEARVAMVVDLLDVQHVKVLHTASEQDLAKTNMLATTKARS
ncbi:hypothetical protein DYB25_000187 [Aphanomyces astaci]|uniref:Uncharacterized protein n=1 Tax=Aphanomyces astaci TaxID=112090 RepID=A0A397FXA8_APHAT|nr:hypothetical protein DYB25_000187 [Aphanomyces astaci]RHY41326.1 hypothetical protein DYB34_000070 [Aphanomyces astaci]RHY60268.1 hypothetical protein DYB38_000208 [Aphanomyces astaci]RHY64764.1 hypothetical protein DYB30_000525 [Aphanomyces astaci]RHZ04506.1 hypothetical protein DYB26_003321 [Aphanomyces astaci]